MDAAELGAWIGSMVAAAAASTAGALAVRRRRGWRPRLRLKGYFSLRTHESAKSDSLEPGPDEKEDTQP